MVFVYRLSRRKIAGRIAVAAGVLLVCAGLLHWVWGTVDGASWSGPLSYRKPTLFGLSFGVTLLSVGWLWAKLYPSRLDTLAEWLLSLCVLGEVALVTLQYWRGRPSHFNQAGPLNFAIELSMTILVTIATVILVWLTGRCFWQLNASVDVRLAIRAGMVLLIASCGIGYLIAVIGQQQLAAGLDPEIYGAAGVLKFPHGVAIHAVQVLPLLAAVLNYRGVSPIVRTRWVTVAILAHVLLLAYSVNQTFQGRPRWEPWLTSW